MRIAVYGICLNEAAFVARFMASTEGADLVAVADTGSSDDTVARFEAAGAIVHRIAVSPWRFDVARNEALALVPDDVDVCVSLDLDQVLRPGWRAALEAGWAPGTRRGYYAEVWARTPDGAPRTFLNNRVHARHGMTWVSPCHEYIEPVGGEDRFVTLAGFVIEQFQDETKDRRHYAPLLELAVAERPHDARALHYLGREYLLAGRPAQAALVFERYLALGLAYAAQERSLTQRMLAQCRQKAGDPAAALALYDQAAREAPDCRGAWIDLAHAHYEREGWAACLDAAVRAAALPGGAGEYGQDSQCGVLPEDMASLCAWRLGRTSQALAFGRAAAQLAPTVERIQLNLRRMEAALGQAGRQVSGQIITPITPRQA